MSDRMNDKMSDKMSDKMNNQMNNPDALLIVGDMADKIKNNVKEHVQQFSWKLAFPKDVVVDEIPTEDIMILNKNLKRLRTEFVVFPKENAISISPHTPYKPGTEYFFCAKYKNKEVCIAFVVTADRQMQTFDQKSSMDKLNTRFRIEARKTAIREGKSNAP